MTKNNSDTMTLAITVEELCNQISLLREEIYKCRENMRNMDCIRISLDEEEQERIRDTLSDAYRRSMERGNMVL
jgi:hypothetical protein